jgi:hypothetical protein
VHVGDDAWGAGRPVAWLVEFLFSPSPASPDNPSGFGGAT